MFFLEARFDANGQQKWFVKLSGHGHADDFSVVANAQGEAWVTAKIQDAYASFLLAADGSLLQQKVFGVELQGTVIAAVPIDEVALGNGTFVFATHQIVDGSTGAHPALAAFDRHGVQLWANSQHVLEADELALHPCGELVLAGRALYQQSPELRVARFSLAGDHLGTFSSGMNVERSRFAAAGR